MSRELQDLRRAASIVTGLVEGGIDPFESAAKRQAIAYLCEAQEHLDAAVAALEEDTEGTPGEDE